MSEDKSKFILDSRGSRIEIQGSEDFVSEQVEFLNENYPALFQENSEMDESLDENAEEQGSENKNQGKDIDELQKISEELNLPHKLLQNEFYLEGGKVHISNPRSIPPKIALLGYCAIKSEIDENHFKNKETKETLQDRERVNMDEWKNILSNGRASGIIKDVGDKNRYKPFKITPKGLDTLEEWLNENSE